MFETDDRPSTAEAAVEPDAVAAEQEGPSEIHTEAPRSNPAEPRAEGSSQATGMSPQDSTSELPPVRVMSILAGCLLLFTLWSGLHFWGLGNSPFHTKGEPREALVVWEMLNGGGWILPMRNGVELPSKPPMFHWLAALASSLAGYANEWTIRLPSSVLSCLVVLLVFVTGAWIWGNRAGFIAALMLLTSLEWSRSATCARVDMTLVFGLTVAFIALLLLRYRERGVWRLLFYTGVTWAILSKGPLAGMLPFLQAAALCTIDRSLSLVRRLRPVRGLIAVILVSGAWYALATREGGTTFIEKQILFENVSRLLGGSKYDGGHSHSFLFLLRTLVTGLLPWSLLLPPLALWLWRSRGAGPDAKHRLSMLAWMFVVFVPSLVASSKRSVYLLPLYPAVCLLLGAWIDSVLQTRTAPAWFVRFLSAIGWIAAVLLSVTAIVATLEFAGVPLLAATADFLPHAAASQIYAIATAPARSLFLPVLVASSAIGMVVLALGAVPQRWGFAFGGLLFSSAAITISIQQAILPAIADQNTRKHYVETIRDVVTDPSEVFAYRHFDYGTVYYWNDRIPIHARPMAADGPIYLLLKERTWLQLDQVERQRYERLPLIGSGRTSNSGGLTLVRRELTQPDSES